MPVSQDNVRRIVKLRANPGTGPRMREALIALARETIAEPECAEFEFLQSLADQDAFILIEDFASAGALEMHMQAAHTRSFFALDLMASGAPIPKDWLS